MVGPFEMVVAIVAITAVAGVIKAKYGHRRGVDSAGDAFIDRELRNDSEAARLREEVRTLKDRIAVLERITVEKENSLDRQIDALRDR